MSPVVSEPAQNADPVPLAMPSGAKSTGRGIEVGTGAAAAGAVTAQPTAIITNDDDKVAVHRYLLEPTAGRRFRA
jgi:hypothetical protein